MCFKSLDDILQCALWNKCDYRKLKCTKDVCCTFKVMRTSIRITSVSSAWSSLSQLPAIIFIKIFITLQINTANIMYTNYKFLCMEWKIIINVWCWHILWFFEEYIPQGNITNSLDRSTWVSYSWYIDMDLLWGIGLCGDGVWEILQSAICKVETQKCWWYNSV